MNNWILHGMSRFSKQHFMQNILVLRRVSFDVDWIENITKDSYKVHAPPKFAGPTTTRSNVELLRQDPVLFILA